MKISTFIAILVIVGAVFFIYAQMVSEANTNYADANINSGAWNSSYDYSSTINGSVAPLQSSLSQLTNENTGWFSKIAAGIAAIPLAITLLPNLLINGFGIANNMITGFFTVFGLPAYLILVCFLLLTTWGIFKLLEALQRWQL
jgi:hypothetical protein